VIRSEASRLAHSLIQRIRQARLRIRAPGVWVGANVEVSSPNETRLANGVSLGDGARLLGNVTIGDHTTIHHHVLLDASGGRIEIGSNCSANEFCVLYGMGGLKIGNDVRMATHTVVVSGNHNFDDPRALIRDQGVTVEPTTIGDDVWIGANVTILAGVEIGSGSVVAAGAVVTHSIPPRSVAMGVPARVVRSR